MSLTVTGYSTIYALLTANSDSYLVAFHQIYIAHLDNTPMCFIPYTSSVLSCNFTELDELTEYTVSATACRMGSGCSSVLEGKAKTWEKRKCF